MNLPNKLTLARILSVPLILLFLLPVPESVLAFLENAGLLGVSAALADWSDFVRTTGILISAFLFLVAALTDTLDGSIARRRGLVTNLGRFLDPIADKILVASVLVALVAVDRIGPLAVIVILLREFVVSALRMVASDHGVVISASGLGKAKTVSQIVAILLLMIQDLSPLLPPVAWAALLVAVVLTLYSGIDYVVRHAGAIRESGITKIL